MKKIHVNIQLWSNHSHIHAHNHWQHSHTHMHSPKVKNTQLKVNHSNIHTNNIDIPFSYCFSFWVCCAYPFARCSEWAILLFLFLCLSLHGLPFSYATVFSSFSLWLFLFVLPSLLLCLTSFIAHFSVLYVCWCCSFAFISPHTHAERFDSMPKARCICCVRNQLVSCLRLSSVLIVVVAVART